jgi:predicted dehydrogenase
MIRLGLIGCGEHSETGHAIPLARYKAAHPNEIELTAVCDLNLGRARGFCDKYDFLAAYIDMEEMLARHELDGCIAVLPVQKIANVGIRLLEAKIPCVVEKPLATSSEELSRLIAASRFTGTPNMVSVNRRFMPLLNRAIAWSRSAGTLRYVRCTLTRQARTEPEFLWTTAVHAVDTLRHIAGDVAEANIHKANPTLSSTEWYTIDFRFGSGVLGRIDVLPTAGMLEETYELIGEGFRTIVTCPFGPQRLWRSFRDNRVVDEEVAPDAPEDMVNGCYHEASEFVQALTQKRCPHPSIENVMQSVQLCLEMAKSVQPDANLVIAKS